MKQIIFFLAVLVSISLKQVYCNTQHILFSFQHITLILFLIDSVGSIIKKSVFGKLWDLLY
jgi:hypothetical protein